MAKKETDYRIIEQIALSLKPISALDISKSFGKNSYSHVHKACDHLVEIGAIEFEKTTNKRNAPKKIFRLTNAGFFRFVNGSDLFSKLDSLSYYPDEKLKIVISLFEQWKHLHEGIECFYNLLMKFRNQKNEFPNGVVNDILSVFHIACCRNFIMCAHWHKQRIAGKDGFDFSDQQFFVLDEFIYHAMKLPGETNGLISYEDIVEFFKDTSSGKKILKESIEKEFTIREGLNRCYQKYF